MILGRVSELCLAADARAQLVTEESESPLKNDIRFCVLALELVCVHSTVAR